MSFHLSFRKNDADPEYKINWLFRTYRKTKGSNTNIHTPLFIIQFGWYR